MCCVIKRRFEFGFEGGIERDGADAGGMEFIEVGFDFVAVPEMEIVLAGGVIHVEAEMELVDPVEFAAGDVAVVYESAVVTVVEGPFAGVVGCSRWTIGRSRACRSRRGRL